MSLMEKLGTDLAPRYFPTMLNCNPRGIAPERAAMGLVVQGLWLAHQALI